MHGVRNYLLTAARLLMSSLFIWEGVVQLRNPGAVAKYFASVHVPMPDLAIWVRSQFIFSVGWEF